MTTTPLALPDTQELEKETSPIVAKAKALEVKSAEDHALAQEIYKALAERKKKLSAFFKDLKDPINAYKEKLLEKEREHVGPVDEAMQIVSKKATDYSAAERVKAEKEAAERAAKAKKEAEDRKLAEAQTLAEAGFEESANAVLSEPVQVAVQKTKGSVASVKGVGETGRWGAVVFDKMALIKHVAANPDLVHLLDPAMPALNQLATALKEAMKIPGVKAEKKTGLSAR